MGTRDPSSAAFQIGSDPANGIGTEPCFFGAGDSRMFGMAYAPTGRPIAGMLICPPLQSEFLTNYRREVLLARELAAAGFAVARFHYRGTGHSDGDERSITFDSMLADADEAAAWLRARSGVETLAFLGTRLSAMTALAVAAARSGAPVVLWDPVVDGDRYFQELFRFRKMSLLSRGERGPQRSPFEEIRESGFADIFGYRIDRALFDSFRGRALADQVGAVARPILLIQMDVRTRLRSEYASLVDAAARGGSSLDVELFEGKEGWWFPGGQMREPAQHRSQAVVEHTRRWLSSRISAVVPR